MTPARKQGGWVSADGDGTVVVIGTVFSVETTLSLTGRIGTSSTGRTDRRYRFIIGRRRQSTVLAAGEADLGSWLIEPANGADEGLRIGGDGFGVAGRNDRWSGMWVLVAMGATTST
jgi:hypothetical protein